jgi:GNAT superfamily N-acetyltransferase
MSIPRHEQAFFNELNSKHIISFVAEDAGRIIGFITGGYERNGDAIYSGEIYTLYVLKNLQRKGIGTKLVLALAMQFNRLGIYSILVRVLKLNPYRRFYKKINGTYLKTERLPFANEIMDVEIYGWLDTTLIDD